MQEHPEGEEQASKQLAPLGDGGVDGARTADGYGNDVREADGDWGNHQRRPLDDVEIRVQVIFILSRRLGRQCERNFHSNHDLEQPLHDGRNVSAGASDDPKLLVTPPLLQRDARPLHFQNGQHAESDGDGKKVDQEREVQVLHDKLASEERQSREEAVNQQKD